MFPACLTYNDSHKLVPRIYIYCLRNFEISFKFGSLDELFDPHPDRSVASIAVLSVPMNLNRRQSFGSELRRVKNSDDSSC